MRTRTVLTLGCAIIALTACNKKTAEAPAPDEQQSAEAGQQAVPGANGPTRKAGLWEITVSGSISAPTSTRQCVDAASDAATSLYGAQLSNSQCSESAFLRQPDGSWKFHRMCDMGSGGMVTLDGTISGDFDNQYSVDFNSTTTGAEVPQMNRNEKITVKGKWVGACPADMKPGDMELPNGTVINMSHMTGAST